MARGSPGGVLLIGVGVVLLSLGWTGRFAAVWAALTGNSGGSGTPTPSPGSGSSQGPDLLHCANAQQAVSVNGQTACYDNSAMASPEGGKCRSGYTPGTRQADGAAVCVLQGAGTQPGSGSPAARCVDRRSIPANQVGIHTSDWKDCCTKEILMYNANAGQEPYLCITRESDISKAQAQGYSISFQGTAGEASTSIVPLPTGFFGNRYMPNGRL